jgi:hypothetical protein
MKKLSLKDTLPPLDVNLRDRAYCAECPLCAAVPRYGCTADSGRGRAKPHADRVARANGLGRTPRSGCYAVPRKPHVFSEAEKAAFQALGHKIPE